MSPAVRDADQKRHWEHYTHGRKWDHPVVAFFVRQRLDHLARHIDWASVRNVLDVGCGYGNTLYYLKETIPVRVGVDGSAAMLSGCPKGAAHWAQVHVSRLPFPDGTFDCVMAWEILHHLEDPGEAVKECVRVARRYVVLFEPNRFNPAQFLLGLLDRSERGTLRFSQGFLASLCRKAGLSVRHEATVGATFPNRMPAFLLPVVRRLPFSLPFIGISAVVVGLKAGP